MPDRFAMNTNRVEHLLDALGIPLPAQVARSRALVNQVAELDVVNRPPLSTNHLASQALALLEDGQAVDLLSMVAENSALSLTADADRLLRQVQSDAELRHDHQIRGAASRLLPIVRTETEKLLEQVRKLPQGTPSSPEAAVDGGQASVAAYQALKVLGERHGQLRALHAELLAGNVDATAFGWYRDTKCAPTPYPETAGPSSPLPRLLWLATDEAQAWTPTGQECTTHYLEGLSERQKPKVPAGVEVPS